MELVRNKKILTGFNEAIRSRLSITVADWSRWCNQLFLFPFFPPRLLGGLDALFSFVFPSSVSFQFEEQQTSTANRSKT